MSINLGDVTVTYKRGGKPFNAVDHVDFSIADGDFVTVMGKSGSGKSTLVNLIAGTLRPDSGKIVINGKDISSLSDKEVSRFRNDTIGYVPQSHGLLSNLTAVENILVPARLYGSKVSEEDALSLMGRLGVRELARNFPSELSGGEQRRVAIARALINRPKIVLADEPTSDLDRDNTAAVMRIFQEVNAEGTAVIVVTHEIDAALYGKKLFYMDAGTIRDVSGSIGELRSSFINSIKLL